MMQSIQATDKSLRYYNKQICSPFLTKKEIIKIANDKDVYIHWDDASLDARMKRHFVTKRG